MEFGYLHGMEWIKRMDKRRCGILSPSWLQFPPRAHFSRNEHRDFSPPACTLQPGDLVDDDQDCQVGDEDGDEDDYD